MSEKIGEYLSVVEETMPENYTTKGWYVLSCGNTTLGSIGWDRRWRQYVLYPNENTQWSAGCLTDVATFLRLRNAEHTAESMKRRTAAKVGV